MLVAVTVVSVVDRFNKMPCTSYTVYRCLEQANVKLKLSKFARHTDSTYEVHFFISRYILRMPRSRSFIKVIGSRSSFKVIGCQVSR